MPSNTPTLEDTITAIRAAFTDGATDEEMSRGEQLLEALLAALKGARGAPATPATSSSPAQSPVIPQAPPKPNILDAVIYVLKEQLDDEDRAQVEAEQAPFALPFINM